MKRTEEKMSAKKHTSVHERHQGSPTRRLSIEPSTRPMLVQASPARNTPTTRHRASISVSDTGLSQIATQMSSSQLRQSFSNSEHNIVWPSTHMSAENIAERRRQSIIKEQSQKPLRTTAREKSTEKVGGTSPTPSDSLLLAKMREDGSRTRFARRESEMQSKRFSISSQQDRPSPPTGQVHALPRWRRLFEVFRQKLILSMSHSRILLMILGCTSQVIVHGLKFNMLASLNVMVNHTAVKKFDDPKKYDCPDIQVYPDGPFLWDEVTQRMMLNGYHYGYMGSPIAGAILSERFGGKWVAFASVVVGSLCSVLIPTVVKNTRWDMLVLVRMVQGAAGGLLLPALTTLISYWAPSSQRTVFCGIVYAGLALGKVTSISLKHLTADLGWEILFHIMVLAMVPWAVIWGLWIYSTPVESFFIKSTRLKAVNLSERHPGILLFPIMQIKNSMAVWALVVASLGNGCGFYMIMTHIPINSRHIQILQMKENTVYYILPYLSMFVVSVTLGFIIDYLRRSKGLPTDVARKVAAAIAMLIPAGCIVGMSVTECNSILGVVLFTISAAAVGAVYVSVKVNHLDISPNFASMLIALTNIFETIPHIIIPTILAFSPTEGKTPYISAIAVIAAIYVTTYIFFAMFASGYVQPWNKPEVR